MATFTPTVSRASTRQPRGETAPICRRSSAAEMTAVPILACPTTRARLRRARLGLAIALTPILMLFVSFTSAYIVRQGLPTLRSQHQHGRARLAARTAAHRAVS